MIEKLKNKVRIESPDLKKRDFLLLGQEVVDEMFHLYNLRQLPGFKQLQYHYTTIRVFAFINVMFLNLLLLVTVDGPGNDGEDFKYGLISIKGRWANIAVNAFQGVIIGSYTLCLLHQVLSRVKLIAQKFDRELELQKANGVDPVTYLSFVPAMKALLGGYIGLFITTARQASSSARAPSSTSLGKCSGTHTTGTRLS